jgi:hypothetical protein
VRERVAARPRLAGLDEEPAAQRLVQGADHALLALLEHVTQAAQLDLATQHRCGGDGGSGVVGQLPEPVSQHAAQAGRQTLPDPAGA